MGSLATFHVPLTSAVGIIGAVIGGYFVIRSKVVGTLREDRDDFKARAETLAADKLDLVAKVAVLEQQKDTVGLTQMMVDHGVTLKAINANLTDLHEGQKKIIEAVAPPT